MPGHVGRSAARLVLRTTGDAAVPPADPPDRDQRLTPRQGTAAGPWRSVRADRTVEGGAAIIADVVSGAEGFGPSHSGHEKETPSMAERTLTAMYDDRSAAEAARDRLVALGVPSAGITIHGTDAGATATSAPTAGEGKGFLAGLADLFAPEEDRETFAEGVRRGGYLLSARVPEGLEDRAVDLLENSGAVDVDERAEGWRQGGWTGHQAGAAGVPGSATA